MTQKIICANLGSLVQANGPCTSQRSTAFTTKGVFWYPTVIGIWVSQNSISDRVVKKTLNALNLATSPTLCHFRLELCQLKQVKIAGSLVLKISLIVLQAELAMNCFTA